MPKYSEKELDSAIKTCIEFLWNKNNRTESNNGKRNIIDIMKHLQNKDGNEYSHRYPYSLLFKITSGCNLRCKHCFYSDKPNLYYTQRDLDEDTLFNYLKFFVEEIHKFHYVSTLFIRFYRYRFIFLLFYFLFRRFAHIFSNLYLSVVRFSTV